MALKSIDNRVKKVCAPIEMRIEVAIRDGEQCIIARQAIAPGEWVMAIEGEQRSTPCRDSVQVDQNLHIAPPEDLIREDGRDAFLWRFLNHSCRPNATVARRALIAIKPIAAGEEITFDYNTTEYEIASPFHCRCGHCDGSEIRGLLFLSQDQRKQREHLLAEYLRDASTGNGDDQSLASADL